MACYFFGDADLADAAAFEVGLAVEADYTMISHKQNTTTRHTLRLLAGAAAEDVFFLAGDLALAAGLAFVVPVMA